MNCNENIGWERGNGKWERETGNGKHEMKTGNLEPGNGKQDRENVKWEMGMDLFSLVSCPLDLMALVLSPPG